MRFYHPAICRQHLNFSTAHQKNSNVDSILLGDKNATSLSFKIISTLTDSRMRASLRNNFLKNTYFSVNKVVWVFQLLGILQMRAEYFNNSNRNSVLKSNFWVVLELFDLKPLWASVLLSLQSAICYMYCRWRICFLLNSTKSCLPSCHDPPKLYCLYL